MKAKADGRIDTVLFMMSVLVFLAALVALDDEYKAGALGLFAYVCLSVLYTIIVSLFNLPNLRASDFFGGIIDRFPFP